MEWTPEKLCTSHNGYELLVERFKHSYECNAATKTWKWRVIHSGVVMSQGTTDDLEVAQKLAESNIPLNN